MAQDRKLIGWSARPVVLLSLVLVLLLSGCEIPRSPEGPGDLPEVTTPIAIVSPTSPGEAPPPPAGGTPPTGAVADLEVGPPAPLAPEASAVEPGTVLIKLNPQASIQARSAELGADNVVVAGIPTLDQRLQQIGASDLEPVVEQVAEAIPDESIESLAVQAEDVSQLYTVSFSTDQNPQQVADQLEEDPTVEYAEPNFLAGITAEPQPVPAHLTPNDPYFQYQWNMQAIQMPAAWDITTGQGAVVAVVDTGVDFGAPDLANVNRLPGYDFANNDTDPTDDQGHGTHVAGTIIQSTNNGVGVAGVAFNAQLLPVKALGNNGQGSYENIIKGIVYAVDQGARVINLSLAGRAGSQALQEAVQYAHSRGVVIVAAAGNSSGPVEYPAAYDDYVIAVGATQFDNGLAPYSNFGPQVDLVAPGGNLDVDQNGDTYADGIVQQTFKTVGGGYTYLFFEGTSMASPHVAGLATLILSRQPNNTPAQVEAIMAQTALNLGAPDRFGAGLIQAANALAAIPGVTPPTATVIVSQPTTVTPTTPAPPPTFTATPTTEPVDEHGGDLVTPTFTPTPTPLPPPPIISPTPTFTPAPLPAGELLVNGNFENDQGWIFGDTPVRGRYEPGAGLGGSRAACLGPTSGRDTFSYSSVWQRVTLPPDARQISLRANVYPISQDTPGSDVQHIMILNERFRKIKILAAELSNSQTWETRTYDLSGLGGQTIYVYFSVVNLGGTGRPSGLCVDDVSLTWGR